MAMRRVGLSERAFEGTPRFELEESRVVERIDFVEILFLCLWNLVWFMGAYVSFLRYDVR